MNGSRAMGGQSANAPTSAPTSAQVEHDDAAIAKTARPTPTLYSFDLNVLVTLRELIRERNVTRAAERLGVTQPAVSATLARLRKFFDDELLVRDRGATGSLPSPCRSSKRSKRSARAPNASSLSAGSSTQPRRNGSSPA